MSILYVWYSIHTITLNITFINMFSSTHFILTAYFYHFCCFFLNFLMRLCVCLDIDLMNEYIIIEWNDCLIWNFFVYETNVVVFDITVFNLWCSGYCTDIDCCLHIFILLYLLFITLLYFNLMLLLPFDLAAVIETSVFDNYFLALTAFV